MATAVELMGILRAAAGEASLGGALGRWRQSVSTAIGQINTAIDALQQQQSHPPQAPPKTFVQTEYTGGGAGQALASGTDIVMDGAGFGDIPYNPLNGVFTLAANKNYRLTAHFALVGYTGETTNVGIEWVDANTNVALHADHGAFLTPVTNTNNENFQPTAETFHTTSVPQNVKLRVTGATGTATANPGLSYALVEEI